MAKGYAVVTYRKINNPEKWGAYAKIAGGVIPKLGGRFIIRGMPAQVHEKGVKERVVIVEFDSLEKALAVYSSPEYKEALKVLGDGAERDFRVVEGAA
jgi:uncharacterized protein (DUF1330 family)